MPDFKGIPESLAGSLQENVLTLVCMSDAHCKMVMLNVPIALYSNEIIREVATQAYDYVRRYKKAPRDHLPDLFEGRLKEKDARSEMLLTVLENIHQLSESGFNEEYVVNQLSKFIRQQQLKECVVGVIKAADEGDIDKADAAVDTYRSGTFTQFQSGLTLGEYVRTMADQEARVRPIVSLGIPALDKHDLGPARKELHTLLAPPKRGKTWWLLHLAKNGMLQHRNVVYITLEVSEEIIAARLLQSLFSMTRAEVAGIELPKLTRAKDGVVTAIEMQEVVGRLALTSKEGRAKVQRVFGIGRKSERALLAQVGRLSKHLVIQSFPTGQLTLKALEAYLENLVAYNSFMPDLVILDYADLMHVPVASYRLTLGAMFKDLRGMAVERNFGLATASQSNRSSTIKRIITERDVAEDFSKIAISDVVLTYNQMPEEREMHTARIYVAAARNSKDRFQVILTQAYEIGQFCLESFQLNSRDYELMLPRLTRNAADRPDDDEEGE